MRGLRRTWIRGERRVMTVTDGKGRTVTRLGKNGGPVVQQSVTLVLVPKEARPC